MIILSEVSTKKMILPVMYGGKRFDDAVEAIEIGDLSNTRGLLPAFAERILKELKKP